MLQCRTICDRSATMLAKLQQSTAYQWRKVSLFARRRKLVPAIEYATLAWLIVTLIVSYLLLTDGKPGEALLTPPLVGLLLVANLIPAIALLVLLGRRIAYRRAAKSEVRGQGLLHSRLVGLFSTIAAIPVLLLVIFASLLFQYGFDFWYSQKAKDIFENSNNLAQEYYKEKRSELVAKTEIMAFDVDQNLQIAPMESDQFQGSFGYQVYARELSQGIIFTFNDKKDQRSLVFAIRDADSPRYNEKDNWIAPDVVKTLRSGRQTVVQDWGNRLEAFTPIPNRPDYFLYTLSLPNSAGLEQAKRYSSVLADYNSLLERSKTLQLQFHAALFLIALIVVGASVFIALTVADRVVQPVGDLVGAARRVSAGDLAARVRVPKLRDEIGTLSSAFNQMTARLESQRNDLVDANALLDRRRALIEAVLSSVSAGVIAVDTHKIVRISNNRAAEILGFGDEQTSGSALAKLSPDLTALLTEGASDGLIDIDVGKERLTLAVKIVRDEGGHVITFDDITLQIADQRRAAWSDVARRVAHEIKNPLTPIQLAAERIKRRFAKDDQIDLETVNRLTDTIIRQVGDLRRMVDEFSSFARMPKPVFQEESLAEICKQALFLQEVAHPGISFRFEDKVGPMLMICDRRQLGQAFTNVLKNGVEAIEQKEARSNEAISMILQENDAGLIEVVIADTGIGLPADRDRIVEPYMTTRKTGTGLGLAIVKKIAEEHAGSLHFSDGKDGGSVVTFRFNPTALATSISAQNGDLMAASHIQEERA